MFAGRTVRPAGGCHAYTHQDFRSHVHCDSLRGPQSHTSARADFDADAHHATGVANATSATDGHTGATDQHAYSASSGTDEHAKATCAHEDAATRV